MKSESILSIKNLKWEVNGKRILDIPAFEIGRGEVISIIGPNGAGKSSLLKILALLQRPDSGSLFYENFRIDGSPLQIKRKMAMVFQDPLLLNGTVYNNVAQGLRFRGMKGIELDRRVKYWLECLGLSHLTNRSSKHLSGGEAQRVSIARALAVEPEILFLDEPFTGLDQPTRYTLAEEIGEILRQRGITAIFITHHAEELAFFMDRICVMDKGSIVQEGTPEEVFNKPANETVAALVGIENILEGITGEHNTVLVNNIPIEANIADICSGTLVKLFIRAENILQGVEFPKNSFDATIIKVISLASQYKLIINCGFELTVLMSKGVFTHEQVKPGRKIKFGISPDKIHVIINK